MTKASKQQRQNEDRNKYNSKRKWLKMRNKMLMVYKRARVREPDLNRSNSSDVFKKQSTTTTTITYLNR